MALFGREPPSRPDRRHSTSAALDEPVQHAEWTVRLGADWQLLNSRRTVLAVTNPDRSYSVRSTEGDLLTQTDIAVIDAEDVTAAGFAGLRSGPGPTPDKRAKLRIRDIRSRMIIAECHRTPGGILVRVLPGGPVNQKLVARTLAPAVAEALLRSAPWVYRIPTLGRGELRTRDGRLIAGDTFTRSTPTTSPDRRGGLTWWSIRVAENPFPTSWLFAVLLACEHLRRCESCCDRGAMTTRTQQDCPCGPVPPSG